MKRNVEINGTSPMNDILGAITGPWSCDTINGWNVLWLSERCSFWSIWAEKGKYQLPKKVDKTLVCKTYNQDGTLGFSFLRIGDTSIQFPKNCYAEVTVFKTAEKDK